MLNEKAIAPNFELENSEGKKFKLSNFRGKNVVLYFYPKDNTSGCTTEACNFRDDYSEYQKMNIEIIGVSPDDIKSHEKFKSKYSLPFLLLADPEHKVCKLYEVWGKKRNYGREYFGIFRTTYLIDKKGIIIKVFEGVKPANHSKEVIAALNELN